MAPYRSESSHHHSRQPRDTGIVGDIIGQFGDTLAFYRELVQNSIDADSDTIDIGIHFDDRDKLLTVSVRDHGCGMSRQIIEDQLLVLFRSTKEQEEGKIGKFGIGFVSVLAVQPKLVKVTTSCGGMRHILHLYPDLSFELFEGNPTTSTGTQVLLQIPMEASAVKEFVSASHIALEHWCRHASVPVELTATGPGGSELLQTRIDRPLSLDDATVSILGESTDGLIRAVVGLSDSSEPKGSFFNHGLLLHEGESMLRGLAFSVQDARLGHTLSRDNVRRDQHYERALQLVRDLAGDPFMGQCAAYLRHCLDQKDYESYWDFCSTLHRVGLPLDLEAWPVPIVALANGKDVISAQDFLDADGYCTFADSQLGAFLASSGVRLLRRDLVAAPGAVWDWLSSNDLQYAELEFTLCHKAEPEGADLVLLDRVRDELELAHRRPFIVLASLDGANADDLLVTGTSVFSSVESDTAWVLRTSKQPDPFRLFRRPTLVLNTEHEFVKTARLLAVEQPMLAAQLLARQLLLHLDKLDLHKSRQLLDSGLGQLLEGRS